MGCLALNASFEPLTIIPARRAVRLVLDGKAEILEKDGGRRFRSENRIIPCPSVIRLVRFVHVPRRSGSPHGVRGADPIWPVVAVGCPATGVEETPATPTNADTHARNRYIVKASHLAASSRVARRPCAPV